MQYHINRQITINTRFDTILQQITDFTHWAAWSPWSHCEPDHKVTFTGETGQVGSKMKWDGELIGSGAITISAVADTQTL